MSRGKETGRGWRFFQTLSQPPEKMWPQGAVHHGSRILLLLLVAAAITAMFPPRVQVDVEVYPLDSVPEEAVIARIPFAVLKGAEALQQEQDEAADLVPPTFSFRRDAADSMVAKLDRFFAEVDRTAQRGGAVEVGELLAQVGVSATAAQVSLLVERGVLNELREAATGAARDLLPLGVMDVSDTDVLGTNAQITVRGEEGVETTRESDDYLLSREFYQQGMDRLGRVPPDEQQLLQNILTRHFESSLVLEVVATEMDRNRARDSVEDNKEDFVAGETVIAAHQRIREEDRERLEAYQRSLQAQGLAPIVGFEILPIVGAALLSVLLLGLFWLHVFFYRREIYTNFRWFFLLAILVLAYFVLALVIVRQEFATEALPIAFVALAVAVLWDSRLALVLVLLLAALTGVQAPFQAFDVFCVTLVGGAAAAISVRAVRRRAQTWIFIAIITATYAGALLALDMMAGEVSGATLVAMAWAAGNATVSGILAMGFTPVFEWFTGITTDQTLLEWADPNRPLLKRLSLEAPGTYAHTINVANLAEAAATAIGANGLLCRVGVYYHDVGKVLKPQYFIENLPSGRNPHDKLKPDTSAAIVKEHVIEGLRLAEEENVPSVIRDFIPEHHGTQKIGFFYEKAKEEAEGEELKLEDFSYPGPKPASRETAIALLSDSVESATRALQDPTQDRIRELINGIVDGKINDHQLDEAPLTLSEIAQIREQFLKVLCGMHHQRIDYPATKHLTEAQDEDESPSEPEADEKE